MLLKLAVYLSVALMPKVSVKRYSPKSVAVRADVGEGLRPKRTGGTGGTAGTGAEVHVGVLDRTDATFERQQRATGEEVRELQVAAVAPVVVAEVAVREVARVPERDRRQREPHVAWPQRRQGSQPGTT